MTEKIQIPLPPPLLDLDDLATLVGLSDNTFYKLTAKRPEVLPPRVLLPATRKILFRREDVKKWLDAGVSTIPPRKRGQPRKVAAGSGA